MGANCVPFMTIRDCTLIVGGSDLKAKLHNGVYTAGESLRFYGYCRNGLDWLLRCVCKQNVGTIGVVFSAWTLFMRIMRGRGSSHN